MKGYFILADEAEELSLLENPNIASRLQKVIIVITEKDVLEYQASRGKRPLKLPDKKIEETAIWFYKNYYDGFMESNFPEYLK